MTALIVKYNIGLKTLLQQGISEPIFYGDLVNKFKRIVGKLNFSDQYNKILSRRVQSKFRRTWNLILNFFSLLILVVHTMSLKNPSDATLASLIVLIYPRWRTR